MTDTLELCVEPGDLLEVKADAVLLKHAQGFFSADGAVARAVERVGVDASELEARPGELKVVGTRGALASPFAAFLGTVRLGDLGYFELRQFMGRALQQLQAQAVDIQHLATTVHGPNFGLDEDEAVLALVGGLVEAFQRGVGPSRLQRVTLVELNTRRAQRLRKALERGLGHTPGVVAFTSGWGFRILRQQAFAPASALSTAGSASAAKPHAFVAMPFAAEMEDVFHYGILQPVREAGLLCERVDQAHFDGPIIQRIRERIETARVVIADLTGANANVYLEVGYAWGQGRPTILLVRDLKELRFDVASYRCLVYGGSIRTLETLLSKELARLGQPPA